MITCVFAVIFCLSFVLCSNNNKLCISIIEYRVEQGTKLIRKPWFYFSYTPCIKCYCSNKILSSCNELRFAKDIKSTKPWYGNLYYIRFISPWCTISCEQKLYIPSDCAVLWAKTSENIVQKTVVRTKNRGQKQWLIWHQGTKNMGYCTMLSKVQGYKRGPFCSGQHYPAWPYSDQCNQCVPAYHVWAVLET
jgi:hypothetical protein